jgi:putative ABC transport system permease protein
MNAARAVVRAALGGALGRNRGRLVLSVVVVALGVALGFAVALINEAAVAEFTSGMKTLSGVADLEVRGPRGGFDEALFARLARDPDVAVASPIVEVDARIAGRDEALRIYGVDAFRAAAVTPAFVGTADNPLDVLRPGVVFVSPAAAAWLAIQPGDNLTVQTGLHDTTLAVAGLARAATGERYAVMDIAAAQDAFARGGLLSRIDLRVRPGVDGAALRARIAQALPDGVTVTTPQDTAAVTLRMSRSYRVNLNVLALVALFTGGLLVFSTQTLSVVRRRAHFALLRTLGLARSRLVALLVGEGALIGALGSLLGLVGGYVLANVVLQVVGADLGAGFFRGVAPRASFDPRPRSSSASWALPSPCWAATFRRARPRGRRRRPRSRRATSSRCSSACANPTPGLILLAAGLLFTLAPPVVGLPLFGYFAIALLLIGTLLLLPRLAAWVLAAVPAPRAVAPRSHSANCGRTGTGHGQPRHDRRERQPHGVDGDHGRVVPAIARRLAGRYSSADVYVRAGAAGDSAYFSADDQRKLAALDGVAHVSFLRVQTCSSTPRNRASRCSRATSRRQSEPDAALDRRCGHRARRRSAAGVGERGGGRSPWPAARRATASTARGKGANVHRCRRVARLRAATGRPRHRPRDLCALTGDTSANDAAVWLRPGVTLAHLRDELDAAIPRQPTCRWRRRAKSARCRCVFSTVRLP